MNKNYLLAVLLLLCFNLSAVFSQTPGSTASIFFETNQSALTDEARQTLDALAPVLLQAPDYQVNIEAFTDDRGTEAHNLRLAADRAASVQQYLAGKGLIADKSTVQNWGERRAEAATEAGRQKSRRVDVAVNSFYFNDFQTLQNRLSANTEQALRIQANQEQALTAAKGTHVIVPANAFVFEDGTAPSGAVDLFIQEAYDPSEFILHNLTTMSDGRILQTGGMVKITASSEGKALQLADGMSLTVSIPNGGNFDPSMELFYARPVANGGVDWKPAGQKFRKTLKPTRIELKIDPSLGKRIAALKVADYPKPALPAFKGQMPPEPTMPVAPYKPHAPKKPDWDNVLKTFAGGGDASRLSRKDLKKASLYFNEQMVRYERDSAKYVQLADRYQRNFQGYEKAKLKFAADHQNWEQELKTRLRAIALYKREMYVFYYSKSLVSALKIKAKTIQSYETYSNLYWEVDNMADAKTQQMMMGGGFSEKTRQSVKEIGNIYESIIGYAAMDKYPKYQKLCWEMNYLLPNDTSSRTMNRILSATGLRNISDSLQAEIKEKTLLSAKTPEQFQYAMQGYVASVSQLGWINCDRFYDNPAEKMQVVVQEPEDAMLYAVCKDIRSMLSFTQQANGDYVTRGLPKGQKITIVAIKIKDGVPQFAQHDMKVGEGTVPSMAYRSLPLRDLKEELRKLNI